MSATPLVSRALESALAPGSIAFGLDGDDEAGHPSAANVAGSAGNR